MAPHAASRVIEVDRTPAGGLGSVHHHARLDPDTSAVLPTWKLDHPTDDTPETSRPHSARSRPFCPTTRSSGIWKGAATEHFDGVIEARGWAEDRVREFIDDFGRDCHVHLLYIDTGEAIGRVEWDWADGTLRWQDPDPVTGNLAAGGE